MLCSKKDPEAGELVGSQQRSKEYNCQIVHVINVISLTCLHAIRDNKLNRFEEMCEVQYSEHLAEKTPSLLLKEYHSRECGYRVHPKPEAQVANRNFCESSILLIGPEEVEDDVDCP